MRSKGQNLDNGRAPLWGFLPSRMLSLQAQLSHSPGGKNRREGDGKRKGGSGEVGRERKRGAGRRRAQCLLFLSLHQDRTVLCSHPRKVEAHQTKARFLRAPSSITLSALTLLHSCHWSCCPCAASTAGSHLRVHAEEALSAPGPSWFFSPQPF